MNVLDSLTPAEQQRALDAYNLLNRNDSLLLSALEVRKEYFTKASADCAAQAADDTPAPEPTPGYVNIRPTPRGFAHMVGMFTEEAEKSQKVHDLIRAWQDMPGDEED
jgi:hypothetical protein